MNTEDFKETFEKFSALMKKINNEIESGSIENKTLGTFKLTFVEGKCTMICIEDPPGSGIEVCYCEKN